jgi:drug/metabolite transporter (DMT)-like permease
MPPENRKLGILLATIAASLQAFFLIPYKIALENTSNDYAVISLLFFAAVFNSALSLAGHLRARTVGAAAAPENEKLSITLFVIGALALLSIVGNHAAGEALSRLTPAVASVLLQTQVLFVSVVGVWVLGERISAGFALGALVSIGGVAAMRIGEGQQQATMVGTVWGLCAAFSFGMVQVVTRKYITRIRPVVVNAARLWLSVAVLIVLPGRLEGMATVPAIALWMTAAAAFGGPFIARLCLLYSARHIPAALSTLFGLVSPVATLAIAWLILGDWPSGQELLGGAVVLVGMFVALRSRAPGAPTPPAPTEATAESPR